MLKSDKSLNLNEDLKIHTLFSTVNGNEVNAAKESRNLDNLSMILQNYDNI